MKRVAFVLAVVVACAMFASASSVSMAQAAPMQRSVAHVQSAMSGIILSGAKSTEAHPAQQINCTGHRTFWYELVGARQNAGDFILQSNLWVQLDYYTSSYCGYTYTEGQDHLLTNCHTFEGAIFSYELSKYSVFHCTAQEYDFKGPVTYLGCSTGQSFYDYTQGDEGPWWVPAFSPTFYC